MSTGFITLHRKITHTSWYGRPEYVALFIHLLMRANHKERTVVIGNQSIVVKRGQFIAGRKSLSAESGVQESKVNRIINVFKSEQQIEQQAFSKFSLYSITNYDSYQSGEQQIEQQMNSKRTADEQQMNTNNNVNNVNNVNNTSKPAKKSTGEAIKVLEYLNKKAGSNFKPVDANTSLVNGRIKEGYTIEDCFAVIDSKHSEWVGSDMEKFLRPSTLFGTKNFSQYQGQVGMKKTTQGGFAIEKKHGNW